METGFEKALCTGQEISAINIIEWKGKATCESHFVEHDEALKEGGFLCQPTSLPPYRSVRIYRLEAGEYRSNIGEVIRGEVEIGTNRNILHLHHMCGDVRIVAYQVPVSIEKHEILVGNQVYRVNLVYDQQRCILARTPVDISQRSIFGETLEKFAARMKEEMELTRSVEEIQKTILQNLKSWRFDEPHADPEWCRDE